MEFNKPLTHILIMILASACATNYPITSDHERDVDVSAYQSFSILKHETGFPDGANPINKQRIDRAIDREMKALGYSNSETADLGISWFVKVANVKEVNVYHQHYGRWEYRQHQDVYEYQEGTLVIDVIDNARNQVIWHGKTKGRVYEDMTDVEEKINGAVKAMFKKYSTDMNVNEKVSTQSDALHSTTDQ